MPSRQCPGPQMLIDRLKTAWPDFSSKPALLRLADGSTLQTAQGIANGVGATVVGGLPAINLYQFQCQRHPSSPYDRLHSLYQECLGLYQRTRIISSNFPPPMNLAHLDSCFHSYGLTIAYDKIALQSAYSIISSIMPPLYPVTVGVVDSGIDFDVLTGNGHWEFQRR